MPEHCRVSTCRIFPIGAFTMATVVVLGQHFPIHWPDFQNVVHTILWFPAVPSRILIASVNSAFCLFHSQSALRGEGCVQLRQADPCAGVPIIRCALPQFRSILSAGIIISMHFQQERWCFLVWNISHVCHVYVWEFVVDFIIDKN